MPAETAGEQVLTVEELAKHVQGLFQDDFSLATARVGEPAVRDRRPQAGRLLEEFRGSFVERNRERVRRGSQFSQLSTERAGRDHRSCPAFGPGRRLPGRRHRRLARRIGRSMETIRYTLKQFDQEHPGSGGFSQEPRTAATGNQEEDLPAVPPRGGGRRAGQAVLPHQDQHLPGHRRDAGPADRGVAAGLHSQSARSTSRASRSEILGPMPEPEHAGQENRLPSGLPPYLASLYEVPLLTREQEAHLFRKFNYLKYGRAGCATGSTRPGQEQRDGRDRALYDQAVATKNQIVRANLRLVVSIAKRHVGPAENFFELVSDGNMSLMRAVEKFDYRPGKQVQHLRELGDHEKLRPHDPRRTSPSRSVPHQPRRRCSTAPRSSERDQYEQESAQVAARGADRANSGAA